MSPLLEIVYSTFRRVACGRPALRGGQEPRL